VNGRPDPTLSQRAPPGAGLAHAGGRVRWHRALWQRAILRGLRAPREPHEVPPEYWHLAAGLVRPLVLPAAGDGRLAAWAVHPREPGDRARPAVVAMHGWGANASSMRALLPPLLAAGMSVLLLDARCHGLSSDAPFTSMPRFAEDIASGLAWLRTQPDIDPQRIALVGHSVGAAAALLLASGRLRGVDAGLPRVRAVVSLASFAHPEEVMRRFLAAHRVPYPVVGSAVLRHVQRVIGYRFDDIAPIHTLREVACPVLLVHGRHDATVPFGDAQRLAAVARGAQLLAVDGPHDLRDALRPYSGAMLEFLGRSLAAV
jgi:uncharacterized protein